MATYTQMVDKILDWSNRTTDVLSHSVIKDCINYAVDMAYRDLRIVPLEHTVSYTIGESSEGFSELNVPSDVIEFIELNYVEGTGADKEYYPYSSKLDIRSFREAVEALDYQSSYSGSGPKSGPRFWTRERGNIVLYPSFRESDTYELHYYRRLPNPDARFTITSKNFDAGLLIDLGATAPADVAAAVTASNGALTADDFTNDPDLFDLISQINDEGNYYLGTLAANWLRDENEKVILFGALSQAFDYLDEMDQSSKYTAKFAQEIAMLNKEEKMRMPSGGTVPLIYTSNLI